jgi:hypothetical protein
MLATVEIMEIQEVIIHKKRQIKNRMRAIKRIVGNTIRVEELVWGK